MTSEERDRLEQQRYEERQRKRDAIKAANRERYAQQQALEKIKRELERQQSGKESYKAGYVRKMIEKREKKAEIYNNKPVAEPGVKSKTKPNAKLVKAPEGLNMSPRVYEMIAENLGCINYHDKSLPSCPFSYKDCEESYGCTYDDADNPVSIKTVQDTMARDNKCPMIKAESQCPYCNTEQTVYGFTNRCTNHNCSAIWLAADDGSTVWSQRKVLS